MARRYYSSTAQRTQLAGSLSDSATTMIVAGTPGFPGTRPYTLMIDPDGINEEIVEVTAASGVTLTVTRGVDGTTAVAHDLGAAVAHAFTARDLDEPNAHIAASNTVHGVTGSVVGTGGTQTLTGKSMSGADNTFSNIPQSAVTNLVPDLALKAPLASPTFTGTVVLPATTSVGDVSSTELGYVNGVTSSIQTQLDNRATVADLADTDAAVAIRASINSPTFTGTVSLPTSTSIGAVTGTEISYLDGALSNVQEQLNTLGASIGTPTYREAVLVFTSPGTLSVSTGASRFRFPFNATLLGVSAACNTAPTGFGVIVDVNLNGTTVFTDPDERPQIAIGLFDTDEANSTLGVVAVETGDYLTVDIDSVGSGVAGSDLTVIVRYQY